MILDKFHPFARYLAGIGCFDKTGPFLYTSIQSIMCLGMEANSPCESWLDIPVLKNGASALLPIQEANHRVMGFHEALRATADLRHVGNVKSMR